MEKKIYPTAEELSKINSIVHCTEEGCNSVFSSESNLTLHLAKTHKKEHLLKADNITKQFHCPELSCMYNASKYFKNIKLLKQHYLKVHSERNHICDTCKKGFPTLSAKNNHMEYCGIVFTCTDCNASYPSYESLTTHARRKKHSILDKSSYKNQQNGVEKCTSSTDMGNKRKIPLTLPKGSVSLQIIVVKSDGNKVLDDKSSQTDEFLKHTEEPRKILRSSSSQTMGLTLQKSQSVAETQTVGDYITRKNSLIDFCSNSDDSLNRKSIKTQTRPVSSTTKSCNTSFNLNDFEFLSDIKIERNSSSTQTVTTVPAEFIYSTTPIEAPKGLNFDMEVLESAINPRGRSLSGLGRNSDFSTGGLHTDGGLCGRDFGLRTVSLSTGSFSTSSLGNGGLSTGVLGTSGGLSNEGLSTGGLSTVGISTEPLSTDSLDADTLDAESLVTESFFNCNMETQTDSIFSNDDLLSADYYSHMYTQTCDDILLNDLEFNNTHTQTVFDEMLRSVESQTMMSQGHKCPMSCRDMAHMETQTDIEFKQILEEINA